MSVRVRAAVEHVTQVMSEEGFDVDEYIETVEASARRWRPSPG